MRRATNSRIFCTDLADLFRYIINCYNKVFFAREHKAIRDSLDWFKSGYFLKGISNAVEYALKEAKRDFGYAEAPTHAPEQLLNQETFDKRLDFCKNVLKICDIVDLIEKSYYQRDPSPDVVETRTNVSSWILAYPIEQKKMQEAEALRQKLLQEKFDAFRVSHFAPLSKVAPFKITFGSTQFDFDPQGMHLDMKSSRFGLQEASWTVALKTEHSNWPAVVRAAQGSSTTVSLSFGDDSVSFWSDHNSSLLSLSADPSDPTSWSLAETSHNPGFALKFSGSKVSVRVTGDLSPDKTALVGTEATLSVPSLPPMVAPLVVFAVLMEYVHFWVDAHLTSVKRAERLCKVRVQGDGIPASLGKRCCAWSSDKDKCFICAGWHHHHSRAVLCMDHGWSTAAERCIGCDDWILNAEDRTPAYICYSCHGRTKWHCTKVGAAKEVVIPAPH